MVIVVDFGLSSQDSGTPGVVALFFLIVPLPPRSGYWQIVGVT